MKGQAISIFISFKLKKRMTQEKDDFFLPYQRLQMLLDALIASGYRCVGPQAKDGAILYDTLLSADQLPWGVKDKQSPGQYRLESQVKQQAFGFSNGPQAIKPLLFKPQETVWKTVRDTTGKLTFEPCYPDETPIALIGARACDIAAMKIQDKVFIEGLAVEKRYQQRRESLLLIAVNCTYASDNCFCVSAGTGPAIRDTFDILLTEINEGFVVVSGSERGAPFIEKLRLTLATESQIKSAHQGVEGAAAMQTKQLPFNNTSALRDLLFSRLNSERWDAVAERCLSCGNCTSVCPTCFCHSESEKPSLDAGSSDHVREWDSCFTAGHSQLNGKLIRNDTKKRYRQWVTHKLGSWFDQFGTSGCVGCGRCISWCPVGIDITEEVTAISKESN